MKPSPITHYVIGISTAACLGLLAACDKPAKNRKAPPSSSTESGIEASYSGNLDSADSERAVLWAWDELRPGSPLKVDIYDGEKLLATVTSDAFRQDLKDNNKGDGKHGFTYEMPESIRDGKPHIISARISGTDFTIGSPITVTHAQKSGAK